MFLNIYTFGFSTIDFERRKNKKRFPYFMKLIDKRVWC